MFDIIIRKLKVNKYSMLKHGTVAVVTMFGVWILFGVENIMIAFPIALTSTVMGRQNLYIKRFSKVVRITAIHLLIVTFAFISSQNLIIGIPINFISIFLIMYIIISPYDLTFYKPFLMLYVFTQYASISLAELPNRYLAVIFGVVTILLGSNINKSNEKKLLGNSINSSINILINQINNIIKGNIDKELTLECSSTMRDLAYRIYITRHKKYLTTELGKIQFKIFLAIEHLNLYLRPINVEYKKKNINEEELTDLINILKQIINIDDNESILSECRLLVSIYKSKHSHKSKYSFQISEVLQLLINNINEVNLLDKNQIYQVYEEWERTDIDMPSVIFKEYFKVNTIKFNFAMRMAITLTVTLFLGGLLGFYKIIWAIITVMSVMQPYYEDTVARTKERVLGNIIAILFTGVLINLINSTFITIVILICSLYLLYGYKDYYKISLFASIASICISSLTENINKLLFYRISYVIIGVLIIIAVNKFLFPYNLKNGIEQLVLKITKLNSLLIENSVKLLENKGGADDVRDIVIHSTLLCQKLNLRNNQYGDSDIIKFIELNNNYVIEIGFNVLMKSGIKANL